MRNCVHIITFVIPTSPAIPVDALDTPAAIWAYHAIPALLTNRKGYSRIERLRCGHERSFEPVKNRAFLDEGFIVARLEVVDRHSVQCPEYRACLLKTYPAFLEDDRIYVPARCACPSYSLGWGNLSCAGQ